MNRRAFLQFLTGTAAGVALAPLLDLERLLWVPGAKTIVIPSLPTVLMSKGDIFTISGHYLANPLTGSLIEYDEGGGRVPRLFVVTADVVGASVPGRLIHPSIGQRIVSAREITPVMVGRTLPLEVAFS